MRRFQQSRTALGSAARLTIVVDDGIGSQSILSELWLQVDAFEQRFSRFLAGSELSSFNAGAGTRQPASHAFRKLLSAAKNYAGQTGGLYNPCILPALQRAGYRGSWPAVDTADERLNYDNRAVADWRDITIGDTWAHIPADAALDFGGIGKGYLLDELGKWLDTQHVAGYWLSLGGDILCNGRDANGDSWHIGIARASGKGVPVAAVKNHGQKLAVATSGVTKRKGTGEHGPWHHLIDPRTGRPAETDVLTATACSGNATAADITAKCLVMTGSAAARKTLSTLHETDALLQVADGVATSIMKMGTVWE